MRRESPGPRRSPVGRTLKLIAGAFVVAAIPSPASPVEEAALAEHSCPLCSEDPGAPVVQLTASLLESIASQHSATNKRQLAHIDSLLLAGRWGSPQSPDARERAHLLARLSLATAYRDLAQFALARDRVYEATGADLGELCARYSDVNLFMAPRLARVRFGQGRVCVRYALEEPGEGDGWHGGRPLRWKVRDARIEGRIRRVLDIGFPSGQDGEVNLLFAAHHTMAVSYERVPGPPAPFEWTIVHEIEGVWIRKWGTHRPTAYMLWTSTGPTVAHAAPTAATGLVPAASTGQALALATLPAAPLVGIRVYVPGLKLRLPLLPDINVDDLREAELITPVLDLEYLRRGEYPDWLSRNRNLGFEGWKGHGPVPPAVRERFPDR